MIIKLLSLIRNSKSQNKAVLTLAGGYSVDMFATYLTYIFLPIFLTLQFNEEWAGVIMSIGTLLTFILLSISGALADRIGITKVLRISLASFLLCGFVRLIFPFSFRGTLFMLLCFFTGYGFRIYQGYILKFTPKQNGGVIFGLVESILAIGGLLGTLAFPYLEKYAYPLFPIILIITTLFLLYIMYIIPNDKVLKKHKKKINYVRTLNLFHNFKKAFHFIKENKGYPYFFLSVMLFEGIYFSTIWFLFPLYLIHETTQTSILEGLSLGVYETITIVFGGICGYMADKYGWKLINSIGRATIIIGCILLINQTNILIIVILGALIGIGNNLIYGAGANILEQKNIDHKEDGSFTALQRMVANIGYIILPAILGLIYSTSGFSAAMSLMVFLVVSLGIVMLIATFHK